MENELTALSEAAETLAPYAIDVRYPSTEVVATIEEAEEALRLAREIFDFVLDRLPEEVRP